MIMEWYHLTKNQFHSLQGKTIAAINFSSTEQHASHLPVGTDRIIGEEILAEAAKRAKSTVVVMPSVCYGYSPHHRFAQGYVTIAQKTLIDFCKDICRCVYENGFRSLAILNSHGGNMPALHCAVNEIGEEYENSFSVALFRYWELIVKEISEVRESAMGGMGHAGEFETSLMMHLHPELVASDLIKECPVAKGDPYYEPGLMGKKKYSTFVSFNKYNPDGNLGQPHLANPEKGRVLFESAVRAVADFLDFWCERNQK